MISGISIILNQYDKVIVLEDDIIVMPGFLTFMNRGLKLYQSDQEVYGISGYSFESKTPLSDETYFLPIMSRGVMELGKTDG